MKKNKFVILIIILSIITLIVYFYPKEIIVCTDESAPVCWVDNITYSNRCHAELQERVKVKYEWECSDK